MSSYFVVFSMKKFSLIVEEENFFTKNNEGWMTSTYKNKHEMEGIISYASTYFPTSYPNQVLLFLFSMLLLTEPYILFGATEVYFNYTVKTHQKVKNKNL